MAVQTGQPVDRIVPAEAVAWYLEGLTDEEMRQADTPPPPEDPLEPWVTGDPWFDEQQRKAVERRRAKQAEELRRA